MKRPTSRTLSDHWL